MTKSYTKSKLTAFKNLQNSFANGVQQCINCNKCIRNAAFGLCIINKPVSEYIYFLKTFLCKQYNEHIMNNKV